MPADYKLRLGDGTILAVDEAGLRTWLLDERAMVQPAGSRRWIPLKEALAHVQAHAAAEARRIAAMPKPEPPPPPPVVETPPAPPPVSTPVPPPPPLVTAPVAAPPPPARKVEPEIEVEPEPEPESAPAEFTLPEPEPFFVPSAAPPPAPLPPKVAPEPPRVTAPAAPKPVAPRPAVKATPPARPPAPPVAAASPLAGAPTPTPAPPRPIAIPAPRNASAPTASPLDLAEVARTAFVAPVEEIPEDEAALEPAPPSSDELPVIPFKPLDDAALRERARATMHRDEQKIEKARAAPDVDPLTLATRKGQDLLVNAAERVREMVKSATPSAPLPPLPPSSSSPAPIPPPPSLSGLPVLRFADDTKPAAAPRLGSKGKLMIAGGVAAVLVIATGWAWIPQLIGAARRMAANAQVKPSPAAPSPSPTPPPPTLPPEVQAAVDQLPHLTPETIQIVMKKSAYRPRDPAEVFSRAETAAVRGMSSLPEAEADELSALRLAVARSLRPTDRQRVRGYERIRTGRELLSVSEDVKVLALFARGVRALPPEKRERLQELLGKAIVAELGPLPSPDGTYSAATPGR